METHIPPRKPYPTDESDDEWAFVAPSLSLMTPEAPQRVYDLREIYNGYTGEQPAADAAAHGIRLEVIKVLEAKRGIVLLPRRWVVERSFAWATRFRRLAKDYERLPETVAGLHFVAFVTLMLHRLVSFVAQSP